LRPQCVYGCFLNAEQVAIAIASAGEENIEFRLPAELTTAG